MQYEFRDPRLPGLARYRALRKRTPGASILRALEYEMVEGMNLAGRILDFGGGQGASYVPLLPAGIELLSVNIDRQYNPTHILEVGAPLPFEESSMDGAICFNVLEHIYDTRFVLDEIFRVLKPGATLHISVPFIFRVHGHPDDYSRHTTSWWRETLARTGFAQAVIEPLAWGKATSAQMIGGNGLWPALTTWKNVLRDIAMARIRSKSRNRITGRYGKSVAAVAPGWWIEATKGEAA